MHVYVYYEGIIIQFKGEIVNEIPAEEKNDTPGTYVNIAYVTCMLYAFCHMCSRCSSKK